MFPLEALAPVLPWIVLVRNIVTYLTIPAALGVAFLVIFPPQIRKVALFLVAIGLCQITVSAFAFFPSLSPYPVLNLFPNEVAIGLFTLTGGVLLTTFDVARTKKNRRAASAAFIVIGCVELLLFIDFASTFLDFATWNVWINATPALSFLMASLVTVFCGASIFFLGRRKAKENKVQSR